MPVTAGRTKGCMHSSGRRREDGPEGACSPSSAAALCARLCGRERKAASSTHRLPHEPGSELTARWLDLISSHRISDSNLSLFCERRDASPLSIYVTMTMQYECVILKRAEECVVIQYCTSALPAVHRDHCLAGSLTEQEPPRWASLHKQRCVY